MLLYKVKDTVISTGNQIFASRCTIKLDRVDKLVNFLGNLHMDRDLPVYFQGGLIGTYEGKAIDANNTAKLFLLLGDIPNKIVAEHAALYLIVLEDRLVLSIFEPETRRPIHAFVSKFKMSDDSEMSNFGRGSSVYVDGYPCGIILSFDGCEAEVLFDWSGINLRTLTMLSDMLLRGAVLNSEGDSLKLEESV